MSITSLLCHLTSRMLNKTVLIPEMVWIGAQHACFTLARGAVLFGGLFASRVTVRVRFAVSPAAKPNNTLIRWRGALRC